ncbi:hypothetical protein HID58_046798 [Brassica napus]|uniref:Uncharacterized protein n=1 Tax=Brassica napus TaxID=3708 RepID=A0ABQ8AXE4_BRANA|nr:hypothetical protein HID58_046798 [Brassica napus]
MVKKLNNVVNVFAVFLCLMFSMTATTVTGDSLDTRCVSMIWDHMCTSKGSRVTGINLRGSTISDPPFSNFSALTLLTFFNLSNDLSRCHNLKHLNLSHNIIGGELSLSGLPNLEVLDLSVNKISASHCYATAWFLQIYRPSGIIDDIFNECRYLKYVDLRYNRFSGVILGGWSSFQFMGIVSPKRFCWGVSGPSFELSESEGVGNIPAEIGSISSLRGLHLGNNMFGGNIREIHSSEQLQRREYGNMPELQGLDLSFNRLTGSIPALFGKLTSLLWAYACE